MAPEVSQAKPKTREGSPWTGLGAVIAKEMADHLTSTRMRILEILILLTAVGTGYVALQQISGTGSQDQFLFLKLFTSARQPLPAFAGFLAFLVPLVAIALAFDAVNGEFAAVIIYDTMAYTKAEACTYIGRFCGKERIKVSSSFRYSQRRIGIIQN